MRTRYHSRIRTVTTRVALAAVLAPAGGCMTSVERLDAEVEQLIEQRQTLALGQTAPADPDPEPDDAQAADRDIYTRRPATANPAPDALPAETETQPVQIDPTGERIVEDDSDAAADADAEQMDLLELIAYAIEHAPTYRNRKEGLYVEVLSLIAERHAWGPRFFDTLSALVTGTPERGDFDTAFSLVNEFGVTQRLPYGGQIGASALVRYVNLLQRSSANSAAFDETTATEVSASIDLPLLRGAGRTARESLIQADRDVIYAVRDFERFRREFLVDLANDYFDLVRQQRSLANQRFQMESLKLLAARTRALAEAGEVPPFDAENTAQQVLFSYNDLINAEEQYEAAVDAFKLSIGFPQSRDLVIVPQEIDVPTPKLDSAASVMTAWDYRLDLQTAQDRVDDARRAVKVAQNDLLPDLDLSARVSAASEPDRRRAGTLQLDEGRYAAGATLSLPLDRKIEWTRVRRAQIALEQEKRDYRLFRDQIALQVRRSVRAIEQSRITVQLQQRNVELAERRIRALELREREIEARDMIEAQEDLLNARNRLDSAEADLRSSILRYLLDTGQMRVDTDGRWLAPARLTALSMEEAPARPQTIPQEAPPDALEADDSGRLPS